MKKNYRVLLNPSPPSGGLKRFYYWAHLYNIIPIKPFSAFGWIETLDIKASPLLIFPIKPFSAFGWIETHNN